MNREEVFECPVCGLHYKDEKTAQKCQEFCEQNHACSLEIAKHAVEYSQKEGESVDES